MRAYGGRKIVSFVPTGDRNDRTRVSAVMESHDSLSGCRRRHSPERAPRVDGERADEPARVRRMPYVSNGALPRAARFPPPAPVPPRASRPRSRPRAPRGSATPADSTSHRRPPEPDSTGSVVDRRTVWRPSILADMFWSVVNLIVAL